MALTKLQTLLDKKNESLTACIEKALDEGALAWGVSRDRPASGMFPMSSLGKCLRSLYYAQFATAKPSPRLYKLFHGGVDTGQRIVDHVFRSGHLWGIYMCQDCKYLNTTLGPVVACEKCESKNLHIPEIGLRDLSVGKGLSGKMDLLFQRNNKVTIVEVKAVSSNINVLGAARGVVDRKAGRANVTKKLGGYIQQGNMYLGILRKYRRAIELKKEHKLVFYEDYAGTILDGCALTKELELDSMVLLFEDKNTLSNIAHEFAYNHDMYLEDRARVRQFFQYVEQRELPPREKKNCYFCDFKEHCDKNRGV